MENGRSLWTNAILVEFYKTFWPEMSSIFRKLFSTIFEAGELSVNEGYCSHFPKKGGFGKIDQLETDQFTEFGLQDNRQRACQQGFQCYFLPCIWTSKMLCPWQGHCTKCVINSEYRVIGFVHVNSMSGFILKIDQFNTFDRVDHVYHSDGLLKMGFGENFRKWVKLLYNDIYGFVKHNGNFSERFPVERGVRQGCPLALRVNCWAISLGNLQL